MMILHRKDPRRERGYVLFAVAFVIISVIGFAGLVFDVGALNYNKRRLQVAADAGALGGAQQMYKSGTGNLTQAVVHDVGLNGFQNGVNGVQLTINNPPAAGTYTGKSNYVEVLLSRPVPTTFMQYFKTTSVTVSARAVGGPGQVSNCVYVLDPNASGAFSASGSAIFDNQCGIMVNSSSATGINIAGSSCVTATAIAVVGNYSVSSTCPPSITPRAGSDPVSDPLASLAPPTVGECNYSNFNKKVGVTINPGVYCNGITLTGGTLTMNPGVYILNGGGLKLTAGTQIVGSGITIYNTSAGYSYKPISIAGNTHINLTAPTSGPFEGILFYTDRTISNATNNTITGDNTSTIVGTIYMPGVPLQFIGNSSLTAYTELVTGTLSITGNATINNDYSSLPNGSPVKGGATLTE
jgi:Putative Flp pilus-assembly TadE/G-like